MAIRSSILSGKTRLTQGGDTLVYPLRLGWWERTIYAFKSNDVKVVITPQYHLRPDRVAADYFGQSQLQWLVLQYNNIVDINEEFIAGNIIRLPEVSRGLIGMLNKPIGGISPLY